jgi:hypothetical protein
MIFQLQPGTRNLELNRFEEVFMAQRSVARVKTHLPGILEKRHGWLRPGRSSGHKHV